MPIVLLAGRTRAYRLAAVAGRQPVGPDGRPGFLYLCRAELKARAVRRSWWDQPDKPPTFLPLATPIGAWMQELAARSGEGRTPLGPTPRALLVGRIFQGLRPELEVWGALPDGPATREGLAALAEAWGMAWERPSPPPLPDDPARFRLPGETTPLLGPALRRDVWRFLGAWRGALDRSPGWTDRPGALRAALRALRADPRVLLPRLGGATTLIVDDVLHLDPLEGALLDAVIDAFVELVPGAQVRLCVESPALLEPGAEADLFLGEGPADHPTLRATRALRKRWGARLEAGQADWELADPEPDALDLSDHAVADSIVPVDAIGPVQVRRLGSELAEVRAVAREIKAAVLGGLPPERCYVAFPALDRYVPLLRDAFADYDLPYLVDKGEDLRLSPPVTAARQLLALADEGPERDRLRSLLGGGWVRLRTAAEPGAVAALAEAATPEGAARDAVLAAVAELPGRPRLASMQGLHRLLLESGADRDDAAHPEGWAPALAAFLLRGEPSRGVARRLAGVLADLLALSALLTRLRDLGAASSVGEARLLHERLLLDCGLGPQALAPSDDPAVLAAREDNRTALIRFAELRQEVEASLKAVQATVGGADDAPLRLYRQALDELVHRETWSRPADLLGVHVVGLRDLHGLTVPWLWVGGLVDGELPRSPPPDFLLPGAAGRALPRADPTEEDRAVFASLLRNVGHGADATLILSWPVSVAGQDTAPSPLIQDLRSLRCEDGATLGDHWLESQRRAEAALPAVLSWSELLARPRWVDARRELLPPRLGRSLARQEALAAERADPRGFGRFDGVLALERPHRPAVLDWLRERLGVEEDRLTLATTALESWARCPMRFFFERVLGAREPEPFSLEPDARRSGTLLHAVLERFLRPRIEAKTEGRLERAGLDGASSQELEAARARLAELVVEVADEVLGPEPNPWKDRALELLMAGLRPGDPFVGRLARFLRVEQEGFLGLDPAGVEERITPLDPAAAAGALHPAGGAAPTGPLRLRLTGTVDRVDRADPGDPGAAIWDYKTGKAPSVGDVDRGLSLQPVVYAAAVEGRTAGVISGYRELPEGPEEPRKRLLADAETLARLKAHGIGRGAMAWDDGLAAAWLRRADLHGQLVASGVFPPTLAGEDAAGCVYCPWKRACRVDPARIDAVCAGQAPASAWPAPLAASEQGEP